MTLAYYLGAATEIVLLLAILCLAALVLSNRKGI